MTTLTPQQMRELAYEGDERALETLTRSPGAVYTLTAALRAAADQLEAVERFAYVRATAAHALGREVERDWLDLLAVLAADTAPQEKATAGPRAIPSVRDMQPGSVFTALHKDGGECGGVEHRWFVFWSMDYGNAVYNDEGQRWSAESIDFATVRNYTAPQEDRDV